jgi:hypothetical protein
MMPTVLALLGAPTAALTALTIMYALVPVSCGWQTNAALLACSLIAFVFSVVVTVMAWRQWRAGAPSSANVAGNRPFLALVATCVGAMSALSLLALSIPPLLLSACR